MVGNCNNNVLPNDGWDDTSASTYSEPDDYLQQQKIGQESIQESVNACALCNSTDIEDADTSELEAANSERTSARRDDGAPRFVWLNLHIPETPEIIVDTPREVNETVSPVQATPSPRSPSLQNLAKKAEHVFLQQEESPKEVVECGKMNLKYDIVVFPKSTNGGQIEMIWDYILNDDAPHKQSKEIDERFAFLDKGKC